MHQLYLFIKKFYFLIPSRGSLTFLTPPLTIFFQMIGRQIGREDFMFDQLKNAFLQYKKILVILIIQKTKYHQNIKMSKKVIKGQNDKGSYDYLCKSIIVGDSAVGKTNIVLRFTEDTYKASHTATIGVDFKIKTLNIDGTKIKLQIWDTAGQCKFRNITRTYFKGAIAAIFAFSVTDRTSFENIGDWVRQSAESSDYTPIRILVGNKCDLKTQRIISEEEGRMLAQKYNMEYFDVSAKEGTNISTAFMRMGELMKQKVSKEDFRENIMPGVPIEKTSEPNKKCC